VQSADRKLPATLLFIASSIWAVGFVSYPAWGGLAGNEATIVAALIGGLTRIMPFGDLRNVEGPKFGDAEFKLVDSKVISIKATSTGNNPLRGCRRLSGRLT
jgi:hypothetical protein